MHDDITEMCPCGYYFDSTFFFKLVYTAALFCPLKVIPKLKKKKERN